MKTRLALVLLIVSLFLPAISFAYTAQQLDSMLNEIKETELNVFKTSLEEYIEYCTSKIPGQVEMEQYAIDRYSLTVGAELNICRLKIEKKLNNNPELLKQFKDMFTKYCEFINVYAEVSTNFMMADFEEGTIQYGTMFKNVPACSATRARFELLRVLKRFVDTGDGYEMRALFGSGPIGGASKVSRTFKKLHK